MRIAHMPHVTWDRQKSRAGYQRRFPADVLLVTGKWFRHKYPTILSKQAAEAILHEQAAEFHEGIEAAR
jgi:hypothetical protein